MRKERPSSKKQPTSWRDNFEALKYLPRFFKLIWGTNKSLFLFNLVLRLAKSLIPVLTLWVGKLIIDEVLLQIAATDKDFSQLWIYLGVEFGLALLSDIMGRGIGLTDGLLGDLYSNKSSVELIQKAASVDLNLLEDADFYDKLERARRQTTSRVSLMSNVLGQAQDIITVVSLMIGLVAYAPWLIVLLFVAILPSFVNEIYFSRTSYSLVRSWTPERRELDYLRFIGASDTTAKEIKLFGLADFISNRFEVLAHKYYLANRKLSIQRSLWGSLFHLIGDLAYYAAYIIIILRTVGGLITVGDLTFLAGSFNRLRNQLQTIFSRFSRITESALYLQDYFEFIDFKPKTDETIVYQPIPETITQGFTFENVGFKYPGSDTFVLRHISFTLHQGEKIALIGENGAGKTTLVKLLLRLYEPTEGQILLDGIPIQHFNRNDYQNLFGAIFQDFVRYYFTAADNIGVGKIQDKDNQDQIEYAAQKSLADTVIQQFPKQYQQMLGRRFSGGKDLSGGEWQKVALARAYMKDAPIIILDEPTAALDARAEYEAFERFLELTDNKMAVIISHRFSTVRMADRIIVLKKGRLLEKGTHEVLLAKQGLYAELFELQAKGYH